MITADHLVSPSDIVVAVDVAVLPAVPAAAIGRTLLKSRLRAAEVHIGRNSVVEFADRIPVADHQLETFGAVRIEVLLRHGGAECIGQRPQPVSEQSVAVAAVDVERKVEQAVPHRQVHTEVGSFRGNPRQVGVHQARTGIAVGIFAASQHITSAAHITGNILERITGVLARTAPRRTEFQVGQERHVVLDERLFRQTPCRRHHGEEAPALVGRIPVGAVFAECEFDHILALVVVIETAHDRNERIFVGIAAGLLPVHGSAVDVVGREKIAVIETLGAYVAAGLAAGLEYGHGAHVMRIGKRIPVIDRPLEIETRRIPVLLLNAGIVVCRRSVGVVQRRIGVGHDTLLHAGADRSLRIIGRLRLQRKSLHAGNIERHAQRRLEELVTPFAVTEQVAVGEGHRVVVERPGTVVIERIVVGEYGF